MIITSAGARRPGASSNQNCSISCRRSMRFAPNATVIDKATYSAFAEPALLQHLRARGADGLIVTGSETDVCVLSTVLGAVDLGLRVIVVDDAVCSSSDEGHDALLMLYHKRYSQQIKTAKTEEVLARW